MKKRSFLLLFITVILLFSGCKSKTAIPKDFNQLATPKAGDTIAIMETTMGEIRLRFFPEVAPKAVENFTSLAKKGYYDGLIFHRVIKDFMIQTGDPTGTGRGGESIWGKPFADEINDQLLYYTGTLAMANSGANTNGSQFFIVQNKTLPNASITEDKLATLPANEQKLYKEHGGYPLTHDYTIFGYAYQGMDIVDKIAAVPTDGYPNDKPLTDVKITKITIETYKS